MNKKMAKRNKLFTSKTGIEMSVAIAAPRYNLFKLERSQSLLLPRQCTILNQKEQILLNTLEKNLSLQQQCCLQIQSHYILKYKQRLAGYQRLRMFSEGSINGSCIPPPCHLLHGTDRRNRRIAVSRKSAPYRPSTSLVKFDDQSIGSLNVNITREAGQAGIKASANWKSPRVYNSVSLSSNRHLHHNSQSVRRAVLNRLEDLQSKTIIRNTLPSDCLRRSADGKIKLQFIKDKRTPNGSMLKTLDLHDSSPPDAHLLSVDESSMRPRAYTDPTSTGKIPLPEITIEDCSDPVDKANSDEGLFTVFQSPPRRRANTCPEEFFNRRRRNRPATPPPTSRNKSPINKFSFGNVNNSPVSFVHHRLGKVSEDGGGDGKSGSGRRLYKSVNASGQASPRRSSCNIRSLRSAFSAVPIMEASEKSLPCHSTVASGRSTNGHFSVSKPEASNTSDTHNTSAVTSQGSERGDVYHSKDCRFSQKISPTMDANPLQAC